MPQERVHQLTARQREILLWSCRGKTYADIAVILGLSTGTIKTYLDTARHKLNTVNITHAAAVAVATGIFTPEEIIQAEETVPWPAPASTPQLPRTRR
jgi:DNA-binding CsgD family transcriptional regulator